MILRIRRLFNSIRLLLRRTVLRLSNQDEPVILLDLKYVEHIRPIRWLLVHFEVSGHKVYFLGRFNRMTLRVGENVVWHRNLRIIWSTRQTHNHTIVLTDQPEKYIANDQRRLVDVRYDYSPLVLSRADELATPFTMHTQTYVQYGDHRNLNQYREQSRAMSILFAGDASSGYDNELIETTCGLLGRHRIITHVQNHEDVLHVNDAAGYEELMGRAHPKKIVLIQRYRIDQQYWMTTVACSDFFLAPPGVTFPLSHNLVEAMAVGTIPITNYPHWFSPALVDGETCIAFDTLNGLNIKLKSALDMDEDRIARMRQAVIAYYEEHLRSEPFVTRLLKHPANPMILHIVDESPNAIRRAMQPPAATGRI